MQAEHFDSKSYWENRLGEHYDEQGVGHQSLSRQYNIWLYRVRKRVFNRIVIKHKLDDINSVLDIGSGTGFYIDLWNKLDMKNVEGSDITELAVSNLKNRFPDNTFHRLDIGEAGSASMKSNNLYDTISAMDVLFHIVDERKFEQSLRNIYKLLKPKGYFIWSDNFLHSDEIRSKHIVQRNLNNTREKLHQAGFSIIDRQPMFVLMNQPNDTNSRLYSYWWKMIGLFNKNDHIASILGRLLYPLELFLTSVFTESPGTEIMICQKRG